MEDFRIDIMIDQGPNARSVRLDIHDLLWLEQQLESDSDRPMHDRFTLQTRLDYYEKNDLAKIVLEVVPC